MICLYPFTTFLKGARKKTGLTQEKFAKASGLSIATIQGYEQGKFLPKTDALLAMINVLKEYSDPEIDMAIAYFNRHLATQLSNSPELIDKIADHSPLEEKTSKAIDYYKATGDTILLRNDISFDCINQIMKDFNLLNDDGMKEAVKRVNELTQLSIYKK